MNSTRTLKSIIAVLLVGLAASIIINILNHVGEDLCVDYSNYNPSTLETGLIGDMVSIYESNQLSAINTRMRYTDNNYNGSEFITFELDTIEKFISQIKQGVLNNSSKVQSEKLGLRVYYGAYPEKSKWGKNGYNDLNGFLGNSITEKYEKQLTLVMLPIRENEKGDLVDFHPFQFNTYESGLPKYIKPEDMTGNNQKDNSPEAQIKVMAITGSSSDATMARNHGQLHPPYSNNGSSFKN